MPDTVATLQRATRQLAAACAAQTFAPPVSHAYHPLVYAWPAHQQFLQRYTPTHCRALFLGMNPGPFGMAQTGLPFGDVTSARDYLGIVAKITPPAHTHPKRPVQGFDCPRAEVSGSRLWAFFAQRYGAAPDFFRHNFVINYCPVLFLGQTGANLTPDKLPAAQTAPLYAACDHFLQTAVHELSPRLLIGIGAFAEQRLRAQFGHDDRYIIGKILHPSPASPAANRAFAATAAKQLDALEALL